MKKIFFFCIFIVTTGSIGGGSGDIAFCLYCIDFPAFPFELGFIVVLDFFQFFIFSFFSFHLV